MKLQFWKYQGAGNDFILVDQRVQQHLHRGHTDRIAHLCNRHFGIGADGLILLQNHPNAHFEMVYFNSDGRESTMCGNGGRCIAAFARHLGIDGEKYHFQAIDGMHEAILSRSAVSGLEWVELKMNDVGSIAPAPANAYVLNTGSPHYVRFVPEVEGLDMVTEGRNIRYSEAFRQDGINVNLVKISAENTLDIRTYERGVEDETLACGTGVTAAALAWHAHHSAGDGSFEIAVAAKGGRLTVRFKHLATGVYTDVWLCGPAQRVFSGEIEL